MNQIVLTISYDGTRYLGWQKTPYGPTIEGVLEENISLILGKKKILQAASRTDAGVHARGQVVSFSFEEILDLQDLQRRLNCILPKDIAVLNIEKKTELFHPTLDAKKKEYHYFISNSSIVGPWDYGYCWRCPGVLDLSRMEEGAQLLLGTHDFYSFSNAALEKISSEKGTVCSLSRIQIIPGGKNSLWRIEIEGDRFLYKMMRTLCGSLVYLGNGKMSIQDLQKALESRDRAKAGITAPAKGLFLQKVFYDSKI